MQGVVNLLQKMKLNTIISQINSIIDKKPIISITLGSGLNAFENTLQKKQVIAYEDLDGFLQTSVQGHRGKFIFGYLNDYPILCASGRFHYYEGYSFDEVGIIQRIFHSFNPKINIITNSCGCLRTDWDIGGFMKINEFIDYSFINSNIPIKHKVNWYNNISIHGLHNGTYAFTIGPTYETSAEINDIIMIGGNAVGMSTFPEYLTCCKLNFNSIFISCLTNYGAGLVKKEVKHSDVLKNAKIYSEKFNKLIIKIIKNM